MIAYFFPELGVANYYTILGHEHHQLIANVLRYITLGYKYQYHPEQHTCVIQD